MVSIEEIRKLRSEPCIVKAEKTFNKGFLFGHVSNGGGTIELSDGFAFRIVALNDKFVSVQLLDYGKKVPIKTQSWQKVKEVVKKDNPKEELEIEKFEEEERQDLF